MPDGPLSRRIRRFAKELSRRRVFRVLLAYLALGIGATEVAGNFFPALGFPDWTVSLVAVLVILGLPVALVLAWAFDVVPDRGVETEAATAEAKERPLEPVETVAARWKLVQNLFIRALDVPEGDRSAFLDEAASDDEALLTEVRSLLRAHEEEGPLDGLKERVVAPLLGQVRSVVDLEGQTVLQYEILEAGSGPKPSATDTVSVHYRGTLIDGTQFDSSYERGPPATFPLNRVIAGWTEGLQLMPVGSTWNLYLRSDLAYGERGSPPTIGPGATLIFEVKLLGIEE